MQQVEHLKNSYLQRETEYNAMSKQLTDDVDKLHGLLNAAQREMEDGNTVSTNFNLQKEIEALTKQLNAKGEEMTKMRNLYINEKHAER
jgi:hypothetical protein